MEAESVTPDVTPGSSPAPAAPPVSGQSVLDGMTSEQLGKWELTGDLPDTTIAGSSPAAPAEQAASTDARKQAPVSETGKPAEKNGHRGNADTRVQELLASDRRNREENARLQERLAALERGAGKPDAQPGSSPDKAPTQTEWERYKAMPDAPKSANFDDFDDFTAAMSVFIADRRFAEHTQRSRHQSEIQRHVEGVRDSGRQAAERIATAIKADPEFASKVDTRLLAIETASVRRISGQPIGPQHVIADEIVSSDHTDKLLLHFSTEDGQKDFRRLMGMPPQLLLREFGRIEERLGGAKPASESQAPPPKTLSTAPPPGKTLGTRPTEPVDPSDAALKRKDFAAYEAAENAKAVGAR